MSVCCECYVLSGRGLCDKLTTRPEESYRLWRISVCDLENLVNEEALAHCGAVAQKKKLMHGTNCCFTAHLVRLRNFFKY